MYPRPDRSRVVRNFSPTAENDLVDLGWQEGVLSAGRPFRGEYWTKAGVYILTILTSRIGLENKSDADFQGLSEDEGLLKFRKDKPRDVSAAPFQDSAGHKMWSVNDVIDDEQGGFIEGGILLQEDERLQPSGAPITWWINQRHIFGLG